MGVGGGGGGLGPTSGQLGEFRAREPGCKEVEQLEKAGDSGGGRRKRVSGAKAAAQQSWGCGRRSGSAPTRRPTVRSPSNKALLKSDPLFHLYLICVGLITLSILAIKCLIPGMPIYSHTVIGFAFLLAIILFSTIYTQVKSKKVSTTFGVAPFSPPVRAN